MFNDAGSYSCIVEFVNLQQVSSTTDTLRIGSKKFYMGSSMIKISHNYDYNVIVHSSVLLKFY